MRLEIPVNILRNVGKIHFFAKKSDLPNCAAFNFGVGSG
jgi:hypothetical protein